MTEKATKNYHLNVVTVHVKDEAKGAQCDFICDRELLVQEMGYFKDYLIKEGKFVQEVEILVHCDIKVFDWLMRYVKRRTEPKNYQDCWLSVSNVLALLISSEFLKMEGLSQKCLVYFCEHINAIIASPCSLSCLNENLIRRIVDHLSVAELDRIKDKKDKIKSKLFFRKIEQLFDPNFSSAECPENAARMFQCAVCERILTRNTALYAPCLPWRRVISRSGRLVPVHQPILDTSDTNNPTGPTVRRSSSCHGSTNMHLEHSHPDETVPNRPVAHPRTPSSMSNSLPSRIPSVSNVASGSHSPAGMLFNSGLLNAPGVDKSGSFSATELLAQWFRELGNWRLVFWRLWATINMQDCIRCQRKFPIIELGDGCFYHSEKPVPLEKHSTATSTTTAMAIQPTIQSATLPASPRSCKNWQRSKEDQTGAHEKSVNREERQTAPKSTSQSELIYPCCGLRRYRFDPFEIPSGCHRNQHVIKEITENETDLVARFTVQHRDLIGSWAPKRSFNPNNAPGLMAFGGYSLPKLDAEHLRGQEELIRKTPVCIILPCLDHTEESSCPSRSSIDSLFKVPHIGNHRVSLVHEIPGGFLVQSSNSKMQSPIEIKQRNWMCPNGMISSTMHDRVWDSMKCYRSNQDSQRQDDFRRMQRFSEFLYNQRVTSDLQTNRSYSRQFPGGIYSRLEAQWRVQTGNQGQVKGQTTQVTKRNKQTPTQALPFR